MILIAETRSHGLQVAEAVLQVGESTVAKTVLHYVGPSEGKIDVFLSDDECYGVIYRSDANGQTLIEVWISRGGPTTPGKKLMHEILRRL